MGDTAGTLKYLTQQSGNNNPGLYVFDGTDYQQITGSGGSSGSVPITLVAAYPITFKWNDSTKTLTIGHV